MHIVYLTQNFPPEIGAAPSRAYDMSKNLSNQGHEVTVLTGFPNNKPKQTKRLFENSKVGRVKVKRSFVVRDTKKSSLKRLSSYFSFLVSSFLSGLFVKKPDVIFATTPPLFVGVTGYLLSRIFRVEFVIEVRDLWVDFAEVLNQMNNTLLLRAARRLEYFLYRRADKIITVTDGYRARLIKNGISPDKIETVKNGVNPDPGHSIIEEDVRSKYNLNGKFVVLYAGNIGAAQGLEVVIQAAEILRDYDNIEFLFVGEGIEKEDLMMKAERMRLSNVTFVESQNKENIKNYYHAADMCLVSLKKHQLFDITIPSKVFDCISMNKPILLGVKGEAKKVVEELNAGLYFEPENPVDLAEKVELAAHHPEVIENLEKDMRGKMLHLYNREKLSHHLGEILMKVSQ